MRASPARGDFADIGYVPAIDGLRALAVCSVIAFHAAPWLLPSGLVGVDIFFVISGFVVPASILGRRFESAAAFASFFFARRLRRIAPALIVCLLITMLMTVLFIPRFFFSSAIYGTGLSAFFGLSNFVLAGAVGDYLSPVARDNPFTQTWSLAVEEQFYLLFPLVTVLLAWKARAHAQASLVVWTLVTVLSAALAAFTSLREPMDAFYLAPTRLWELGLGLLVYLTLPTTAPRLAAIRSARATFLAILAAAIVAASLVLARRATYPFPAVVPTVLGTAALVLLVVSQPANAVARLLGRAPLVAVGRLSYSLYLWHWPVFVMLRWTTGFASPATVATGLLLTTTLAVLSHRFVETPFRTNTWLSRRPRPAVVAGALLSLAVAWGGARFMVAGQPHLSLSVTAQRDLWEALPPREPTRATCAAQADFAFGMPITRIAVEPSACTTPLPRHTVFVLGDSHAVVLSRALTEVAAERNVAVQLVSYFGCSILPLRQPQAQMGTACESWSRSEMADIAARAAPGDVVLLSSLRMPRLIGPDSVEGWVPPGPPDPATRAPVIAEALDLLRAFDGKGVRIVISAPLPVFRINAFRCADWFDRDNSVCAAGFDMTRAEIDAMRAPILDRMQAIAAARSDVTIWDPLALLCDAQTCSAMRDGKPLFFDGDHLSGYGNDVLSPSLATALFGPKPAAAAMARPAT